MFPPLCFVDVSSGIVPEDSKESLQSSMDTEEYQLISDQNNNEIKFKFKLVELLQSFGLQIASDKK